MNTDAPPSDTGTHSGHAGSPATPLTVARIAAAAAPDSASTPQLRARTSAHTPLVAKPSATSARSAPCGCRGASAHTISDGSDVAARVTA